MSQEMFHDDLSTAHSRYCSYCLKSLTRAYRCSRCQIAYYCNQGCQRGHWNHGHKMNCRAITSLKELNGLISDMADQPMNESFHTSLDVVKAIGNMRDPQAFDEAWVHKIREKSESIHTKTRQGECMPVSMDFDTYYDAMKSHRQRCEKRRLPFTRKTVSEMKNTQVCIYIEHLPRLSSFSIRLCLPKSMYPAEFSSAGHEDNISVVLSGYGTKTQILIQRPTFEECHEEARFHILAMLLLPLPMTYSSILNETVNVTVNIKRSHTSHIEVSLRIPYNSIQNSATEFYLNDLLGQTKTESQESLTNTLRAFNRMQCRSCANGIIRSFTSSSHRNLSTLKKVLTLPEGHWDEISEYISCFDTNALDFSGSSIHATQGCAFHDASSILLHRKDTTNLSVMAVDCYGENSVAVKDDKSIFDKSIENQAMYGLQKNIDGAAICCDRCCDVLGYSPLNDTDAYRLLKHKLSAPMGYDFDNLDQDYFNRSTCPSFIAKELVRYVESHGIFSFVIKKNTNEDDMLHDSNLLLNVLSLNTNMGHTLWDQHDRRLNDIDFKQVVKVIFEHTTSWKENSSSPLKKWGNIDFCCSPFNSLSCEKNNSTKIGVGNYIVMFLSSIEWEELHETLMEGKAYFDDDVSSATVRLRLGVDSSQNASLTFLELQ